MTTTDDIRRWVMVLPEVEETSHFRFRVPVWKVRDAWRQQAPKRLTAEYEG